MKRLKLAASALLWSALLASFIAPARAETFPSRPIHLILPFQPGGIVDFAGRVLAQKLSDALGQTVVPDNKPGAGGIVGLDYVAHSPPDGYNIVLIDPSVVINPTLQKSLPFDLFKDLATVSIINSSPEVLVVAPQLGIKTYRSSSPTAKPIPASSIMPRRASARRHISPPRCGRNAPASARCTCHTKAWVRRSST